MSNHARHWCVQYPIEGGDVIFVLYACTGSVLDMQMRNEQLKYTYVAFQYSYVPPAEQRPTCAKCAVWQDMWLADGGSERLREPAGVWVVRKAGLRNSPFHLNFNGLTAAEGTRERDEDG